VANLPQLKINIFRFIPAIAWFLLSFWLLTMPGSKIPHEDWFDTLQVDKWVHIALFSTLCFLFMVPLKKMQLKSKELLPWLLLITVSAILYGVIMEFIQRDFVPNRSFDIWDIVSDTIGCVAAFFWCRKKLGVV
jgi:VanZ family protein